MALCIALLWSTVLIDNTAYTRMKICYDNSMALANRITMRVEMLEEYTPDVPVAIVGTPDLSLYMPLATQGHFQKVEYLTGTNLPYLVGTYSTMAFFNYFVGIRFALVSEDQRTMLENSEFVSEMPSYPQSGSIQYYDGIVIIKLGNGSVL